jgi:hypothetical protein
MKIDKGLMALIICIVLLAILIIVPIAYAPQSIPVKTNDAKPIGNSIEMQYLHNDSLIKACEAKRVEIMNHVNQIK